MTPLAEAVATVLFGALAGGITNSVAIWMLFHPYTPPRLFGRTVGLLQGAIPKNKARLAARIGRTVGDRLLTPEDLAQTVSAPAFRQAFDERLGAFLRAVLERPRGALAQELPPPLAAELERVLDSVAAGLAARVEAYIESDDSHAAARRWADSLAEELRDQPIAELLTAEREQRITTAAERWLADTLEGPRFERAVREYLDRAAGRLLVPGRTFQDVLPVALVAAVERAVAGYLPLALERLGTLLEDPDARLRLEAAIHELLERFLRDLNFYQRIVAALVITPDTVERVLRVVEDEGADQLAAVLQDPAVRDAMARNVNDAIVEFLRKPVETVLGRPGEPGVEDLKQTAAGWALAVARDPGTHTFLVEKLRATLDAAERRTWGDLFRHLPPESLADAVVAAARSERARALYREAAARLPTLVLERTIGRPADHLPQDAVDRLRNALSEPLWIWLQEQVPSIAQRVDVAGRIERKILEYPTAQLEQLIRGVTERELRLIVRLGYVLGGVIGASLVLVNSLL